MARHTSILLHETILRLWKQGKSSQTIVGVEKSMVNVFLTKYHSGYGLKDKHRSSRPRKTTVQVDKINKRKSTADPRKKPSKIAL